MIKMKYALLLIAVLMTFGTNVFSQKVGSTSMQFLSVIPSAHASGMGSAYVSVVSGVEGVFWNPAGIAHVEGQELSLSHISWIFDAKQYAVAYARSLGNYGTVAAQFQYVDYGSFEETRYPDDGDYFSGQSLPFMTGRTFKPYSYVIGLTYATRLTERFSTGVSFKFAHESLYDQPTIAANINGKDTAEVNTYGNAYLFDIGILYNTGFHTVKIGASVQNFGAEIKYAKEKNSAPMLFRVGISGDLIGPNSLLFDDKDNRLGVAFDLFQSNDYDQQQNIGAEYEFANTFAVRAGYKFNYDLEGFTMGAGVKQKLGSIKLSFDYSYGAIGSVAGSFGNVHRISIGVGI